MIEFAGQEILTRYCTERRRSRPHVARPLLRNRHEDGEELEDLDVIGGPLTSASKPEGAADAGK